MIRTLLYYRNLFLTVVLSAAIATSILTGALLVGDSLRGSLRDLTLNRLGSIEQAMQSPRFFSESVVRKLPGKAEPMLLLSGSASNPESGLRASRINLYGVNNSFFDFFSTRETLENSASQILPSAVINQSLAQELGVSEGKDILFAVQKTGEIAPETLLGSRDPSETIRRIRATVTRILPNSGPGRFSLQSTQSLPLVAFVSLPVLQRSLNQRGKINTVLAQGNDLESGLKNSLSLEDMALRVRSQPDRVIVDSPEIFLRPVLTESILQIVQRKKMPSTRVLTYIANSISIGSHAIPYSTISALENADSLSLSESGIALNQWAANNLQAKVGDPVEIAYFVIDSKNSLITNKASFRLEAILPMTGIGADKSLAPDFPGIEGRAEISSWSAPFPVNASLVRPEDEAYWREFGAAPKAFVSLQTGQKLWGNRYGTLTSIRIVPETGIAPEAEAENIRREIRNVLTPEQAGFQVQPVRAQGLKAAEGSTDFGMLFIGFSFFLIVSSCLLTALLFRLSVELRAPELGLLLAIGYPARSVRNRLLAEGFALSAMGAAIGSLGACLYAWLMLAGLRTWWNAAAGTTFLFLHVNLATLLLGAAISIAVVLTSIALSVRKLARLPAVTLMSGNTTVLEVAKGTNRRRILGWVLFLVSIAFLLLSGTGGTAAAISFFAAGAGLLGSSIAFLSSFLRTGETFFHPDSTSLFSLAARNCSRNPGRSLLSIALIACACFIVVTVAANKLEVDEAGTGGFTLIADSSVPLLQSLSTEDGRTGLGFSSDESASLKKDSILSFRSLVGDDASCLNLYAAARPTVLGVPENIKESRFEFQELANPSMQNPWQLLDQTLDAGVIPAFADYNSAVWILHLGINRELTLRNQAGESVRLRLVGLLRDSIFQSQLLVSENNFVNHFPESNGYSFFLIKTPDTEQTQTAQLLENKLSDLGFDAKPASEMLSNYHAVQNTYLSTFQTLGGLGLLLGTLGLGVILMRSAQERRGELAMLRALGFSRRRLSKMILAENAFLLIAGIAAGTLPALVSSAPRLKENIHAIPWLTLSTLMGVILITGLIASLAALRVVLRVPLLPALKTE